MIHAHVVCAAVADCAIVIDADRANAWEHTFSGTISITSDAPFGATPAVTLELAPPPPPDGARWTAPHAFAAGDFLPCAKTTVTGTLLGDGGVVWRGSIVLPRRDCAAPPRVRPRVTCTRMIIERGDLSQPTFDHVAVSCEVALGRAPPVPLYVWAQLDDRSSSDDVPLESDSVQVELLDRTAAHCAPARVRLAITNDAGALVWRGTAPIDCANPAMEIVTELSS